MKVLDFSIKEITLPGFVSPNILQVLVDTFGLAPISTPEEDLEAALAK